MQQSTTWHLLVYRLPAQPSSARVAVWRELRRLGALPLQQSCVAVPDVDALVARLVNVASRVEKEGGESFLFRLADLAPGDSARLREGWNALRSQEYAEIVEECQTKFAREVEFEIYRDNLTGAEAEELEADLDKIRSWYERTTARDWFEAPGRAEVEAAITRCAAMLDDFTERVYLRENEDGPSLEAPRDLPWGESGQASAESIIPLGRPRPGTRRRTGEGR